MSKRLFVVPNNDLESITIEQILSKQNEDKLIVDQPWGASFNKLDKNDIEMLDTYDMVYFIEINDVPINEKYILIDHHGEKSFNNKSSLEQVAEIISYSLNEYETLVSENDKNYFEGMMKYLLNNNHSYQYCKKECMKIRRKEYGAIGITDKEMIEAIEAYNNRGYVNGKYIIRCGHARVAPITDLTFWDCIDSIVISGNEVNIDTSVEIIDILKKRYPDCWYGGRVNFGKGFWGSSSYNPEEILSLFLNLESDK